MRPLVVDASSRIATLARPKLAGPLFAAHDACAPVLLRWEIGNVIHGKRPAVFGDLAKRKAIVATLLAPVRLIDQRGREDAIADVVDRTGLTFYDAAYLQLAADEGAPLLTEDQQLLEAAGKVLGRNRAWTLDVFEAGAKRSP